MSDLERIGVRITGYGEAVAAQVYGLHRQSLHGVEPLVEQARVALDAIPAYVHERTMQLMPSWWSPGRKRLRLFEMQYPDRGG